MTRNAQTLPTNIEMFDRRQVRRQRQRAAGNGSFVDFIKNLMVEDIADRLLMINRPFKRILDLGSHDGRLGKLLAARYPEATVVYADPAEGWLAGTQTGVACDPDFLPFADESFDLVVSAGLLHWTNDLPGALIQINRAMTPDGLFMAAFPGGDTLFELRRALFEAEEEVTGGVAPRVAPMVEVRDAGGLLQRAGFAMPVSDSDHFTVAYENPLKLLAELRAMGETNAQASRPRSFLRRAVLMRAASLYAERFAREDGKVLATVELISLSGWAPAPGQPKPLRPGSAKARLADALGVREQPTGDKAG
ncbi:MAG TPA: methyltransferase domain-containing protein [Pedomonas sp.]|uniref:methyltransferase domain-containing protein n=1 Tax=Pedomonas sp. TaxID=2976421 RepID=UPI002F409C8C